MRSLRFTLRFAVGSILFVALFATASMAQNNRTFVSGAGLDSNPCSLTSPCRTFGQAISVTNAGGEVVVLTSAGYGPFAINKAVTVEATAGVYAGITVTGSSDGIDINAGSTDIVILRGLTVNSEGSTGNGIVFNSGATLHIESCVVNSFGNVVVKSTIARGNGNGILVDPTGTGTTATADVAMDHLHLDGNSAGLVVSPTGSGATVTAAIKNSSASGSTGTGMVAVGSGAALDIEGCLIANDSVGVSALTGGTMSISNCTISYCLTGYNNSGGTINTRGQNTNTSPANTGRLTALAGQ
jgi:hypothetical protein